MKLLFILISVEVTGYIDRKLTKKLDFETELRTNVTTGEFKINYKWLIKTVELSALFEKQTRRFILQMHLRMKHFGESARKLHETACTRNWPVRTMVAREREIQTCFECFWSESILLMGNRPI